MRSSQQTSWMFQCFIPPAVSAVISRPVIEAWGSAALPELNCDLTACCTLTAGHLSPRALSLDAWNINQDSRDGKTQAGDERGAEVIWKLDLEEGWIQMQSW